MTTPARTGKIARLPRHLRDALNRRLDVSQPAATILAWLNAEPETKEVLDVFFDGAAITGQNLSVWRQGGFQDWLRQQEDADFVRRLADPFAGTGEEPGHRPVSDWLGPMLSLELARVVRALLDQDADPEKRWQRLEQFLPVLSRLRRDEHRAIRVRHAQQSWAAQADAAEAAAHAAEHEKLREALRHKWEAYLTRDLVAHQFGGGKNGYEAADLYQKAHHDLVTADDLIQFDRFQAKPIELYLPKNTKPPVTPAKPGVAAGPLPATPFPITPPCHDSPSAATPAPGTSRSTCRPNHPQDSHSCPASPRAAVAAQPAESSPIQPNPSESNLQKESNPPIVVVEPGRAGNQPCRDSASNTPSLPHSASTPASSASAPDPHAALARATNEPTSSQPIIPPLPTGEGRGEGIVSTSPSPAAPQLPSAGGLAAPKSCPQDKGGSSASSPITNEQTPAQRTALPLPAGEGRGEGLNSSSPNPQKTELPIIDETTFKPPTPKNSPKFYLTPILPTPMLR